MQCARETLAPNPPFRATVASRVGRRPPYCAWHRRPPRSASPAKLRTASRTAPSRNGRRTPSPATLRAGRRTPLRAARRGEKRAIERETRTSTEAKKDKVHWFRRSMGHLFLLYFIFFVLRLLHEIFLNKLLATQEIHICIPVIYNIILKYSCDLFGSQVFFHICNKIVHKDQWYD